MQCPGATRAAGDVLCGATVEAAKSPPCPLARQPPKEGPFVFAQDTIAVRVVRLDALTIAAPTKRLLVGREIKLHLRGRHHGETAFAFGGLLSTATRAAAAARAARAAAAGTAGGDKAPQAAAALAPPQITFKWEADSDEVLTISATRERQQGDRPHGQWSSGFSVWVRGVAAGRSTVRVKATMRVHTADGPGGNPIYDTIELSDVITMTVVEPLHLLAAPKPSLSPLSAAAGAAPPPGGLAAAAAAAAVGRGSAPMVLLYPGASVVLRTNKDGKDSLYYRIVPLTGEREVRFFFPDSVLEPIPIGD